MKNTDMIQYIETTAQAIYQRMLAPSSFEEAYEYHRGKYDMMFQVRQDLDIRLESDARLLNAVVDATVAELMRVRKWTILPRNRRRIDAAVIELTKMREPI